MRKRQIVFDCQVEKLTSDDVIIEENWNDVLVLGTAIDNVSHSYAHYKYVHGYEMAIKLVYEACASADNYMAYRDQMCHPFLYLCRHTVELKIKELLNKYSLDVDRDHCLEENWNALKEHISGVIRGKNVNIALDSMSTYISAWQRFDKESTRNRYPDGKNKSNFEKRTAINIQQSYDLFTKFMKQMDIFESEIQKIQYGF